MLKRENVLKIQAVKDFNGFIFEELPNIPKINLRGSHLDKNFMTIVSKILNISIPIEPNTSNNNNNLTIMWLSPNEWLIEINNINNFANIFQNLQNSLNSEKNAVTDVSDNRTILKLSGIKLYKLLSKFMIIDLETVLQKKSSIAQTIFIKIPVLITRNHKDDEEISINLHCNRSHAEYIYDLLVDGSNNVDF